MIDVSLVEHLGNKGRKEIVNGLNGSFIFMMIMQWDDER
uniref:Uncharacterized protein n=1 Tax=Arundo donax TaxID=35708 RepID=A0A0A8YHZ7_ARUDO